MRELWNRTNRRVCFQKEKEEQKTLSYMEGNARVIILNGEQFYRCCLMNPLRFDRNRGGCQSIYCYEVKIE